MKTKSEKGMTLVELMAAVATGAFVILATGIIITFGQKSWNREWKRACLERDACVLMTEMTHPIRAAWKAEADPNGKSVLIYKGYDTIRYSQVPGLTILRKKINDGANITLSDKVYDLNFNVSGKKVTTNLILESDNIQASSVSTVMMRNYGGL